MKRLVALVALVTFAAGLIFVSNDTALARHKKKDKEEEKVEQTTPAAPEPKLLHRFENTEEMAEFERLYVSKQATFGRMGVLQAYFAMEQNNLAEVDRQMEEKFGFKMDSEKMYDLDRNTLEIREIGPVVTAAPAPIE